MFRSFSLIACVGVVACCAAACVEAPGARQPGSNLPKWEAHDRAVFDDTIDAAALGLALDASSPRADRFLRERAQTADVVGYMIVDTVTVDTVGDNKRFHLGVKVGTPTLSKPRVEDKTFELEVASGTAPLGTGLEARVRGKTFIGFVHRYLGDDGEPVWHWHLSAGTPDVAAAVKEAVALQELHGS